MALNTINLTPVEKEIGGVTFYIRPFGALTAANISGDLASVASPLITAIAPLLMDDDIDKKSDEEVGREIASQATKLEGLDGAKVEKLVRKLLLQFQNIIVDVTTDDGNDDQEIMDEDMMNQIFMGHVQDMFILCWYVVEVNFQGFFGNSQLQSGIQKLVKTPRPIL